MYMNLPIKPKENIENRLIAFQQVTKSILQSNVQIFALYLLGYFNDMFIPDFINK